MAQLIDMPKLSDTMTVGTVSKWLKKEGDAVKAGDMLAEVETDKATMELESFDTGKVAKISAKEGQTVAVGSLICVIAEEGESLESAAAAGGASAASGASAPAKSVAKSEAGSGAPSPVAHSATAVMQPSNPAANGARVFASPLAKKIAGESNVNLGSITGTGPGGRIVRKDVEDALKRGGASGKAAGTARASAGSPAPLMAGPGPLEDKVVPLSNMRATIARRLVESKATIPHYQVSVAVRMDALNELREQLNEQLAPQGVKLSVNDFLVRACALAMQEHPFVNSSWVEKGEGGNPAIKLHANVNVGVAIALPIERGGGLVVGTLRAADRLGLRQISSETKRLAGKAREKGLTVEEMSDSTFTISNLGMFGVEHFTAIINPPNAAILAVGRAAERVFIEQDEKGEPELVLGSEMVMTMSSDHRIVDGAMAAQYLSSVKGYLEKPATLLV